MITSDFLSIGNSDPDSPLSTSDSLFYISSDYSAFSASYGPIYSLDGILGFLDFLLFYKLLVSDLLLMLY
jgi:hypothetical protein